jgi:hypothetical protein
MIIEIGSQKFSIKSKSHIYQTIGNDTNFAPVLCCRPFEKDKAFEDLTNYFNTFDKVLATGIEFTEEETTHFQNQFIQKAKQKAENILLNVTEKNGYIFAFLPEKN